ncbi:MAG TPA: GapR family DNA-binding domain-containing protein [Methylomirabilota bacterium]|nr:GapR family DNA-binding domain-containing protein [Methylomirabilota bacterium]
MVAEGAEAGVAADELKQFIERIERLEEEKKAIADDVRDVYGEAKGRGYDVKAIRAIVRLRAKEPHEREEEEAILELYKSALGMV